MEEIKNMPSSMECGMQFRTTSQKAGVSSAKHRGDLISNTASYHQDQRLVTLVHIFQGFKFLVKFLEIYQDSWENHLISKAAIVLCQIQDSDRKDLRKTHL